MKPAGSERNMAANIDALRQNASRARRKRGDIPGDGSGGTGALSDATAAAPTMGRERAATARLIGGHIELIEADVMELARLAANSNAGG